MIEWMALLRMTCDWYGKNVNSWQPSIIVALFAFLQSMWRAHSFISTSLSPLLSSRRINSLVSNFKPDLVPSWTNKRFRKSTEHLTTKSKSCLNSRTATHLTSLIDMSLLYFSEMIFPTAEKIIVDNNRKSQKSENFFSSSNKLKCRRWFILVFVLFSSTICSGSLKTTKRVDLTLKHFHLSLDL